MRTRVLASICAVAGLVSAGCLDGSTGPSCQQVGTLVTSTSGDTATTVSGLRYIDTEVGAGATAQSCQLVSVNYVGQLTDGTVFDQREGYPVVPGTFQSIAGFEQGIVGMSVGGTRRLIIPPALGYGDRDAINPNTGEVVIPANSTIVFDVELVSVGDTVTD